MLDLLPLSSYVLITTFTPGPNNISSASMGIVHGYRRTLPYLLGIATGFAFVMLLCGWISGRLARILPQIETIMRWLGAVYVVYLAYHTLRADYAFEDGNQKALGFYNGLLLQTLNPKAITYGLTLYAGFLLPVSHRFFSLALSAVALALVAFVATSTWALFGSAIKRYLRNPRIKRLVNWVLAMLLFYTAIELSGVLALIGLA